MTNCMLLLYLTSSILVSISETRCVLNGADKTLTSNAQESLRQPTEDGCKRNTRFAFESLQTSPYESEMVNTHKKSTVDDSNIVIIIPQNIDEYQSVELDEFQNIDNRKESITATDVDSSKITNHLKSVFFSKKHNSLVYRDNNGIMTLVNYCVDVCYPETKTRTVNHNKKTPLSKKYPSAKTTPLRIKPEVGSLNSTLQESDEDAGTSLYKQESANQMQSFANLRAALQTSQTGYQPKTSTDGIEEEYERNNSSLRKPIAPQDAGTVNTTSNSKYIEEHGFYKTSDQSATANDHNVIKSPNNNSNLHKSPIEPPTAVNHLDFSTTGRNNVPLSNQTIAKIVVYGNTNILDESTTKSSGSHQHSKINVTRPTTNKAISTMSKSSKENVTRTIGTILPHRIRPTLNSAKTVETTDSTKHSTSASTEIKYFKTSSRFLESPSTTSVGYTIFPSNYLELSTTATDEETSSPSSDTEPSSSATETALTSNYLESSTTATGTTSSSIYLESTTDYNYTVLPSTSFETNTTVDDEETMLPSVHLYHQSNKTSSDNDASHSKSLDQGKVTDVTEFNLLHKSHVLSTRLNDRITNFADSNLTKIDEKNGLPPYLFISNNIKASTGRSGTQTSDTVREENKVPPQSTESESAITINDGHTTSGAPSTSYSQPDTTTTNRINRLESEGVGSSNILASTSIPSEFTFQDSYFTTTCTTITEPNLYQQKSLDVSSARGKFTASIAMPSYGLPSAGVPSAGVSSAGVSSDGMPSGMPSAGVPSAGVSSAGVSSAGVPSAGVSSDGMPSGMPSAGVPSAGVSSAGVPSAGIPSAGVSSAGVSSAGIPSAGVPSAGVPLGGVSSAGVPSDGMPSAGVSSAGVSSAGVSSAGVPSGSVLSAGMSSAGVPSGGVLSAGIPSAGVPSGSVLSAGILSAGAKRTGKGYKTQLLEDGKHDMDATLFNATVKFSELFRKLLSKIEEFKKQDNQ